MSDAGIVYQLVATFECDGKVSEWASTVACTTSAAAVARIAGFRDEVRKALADPNLPVAVSIRTIKIVEE